MTPTKIPIQMIVTDLDRTLLRTDKTISEYTAATLKACQQSGIKVVFATARPKRAATHFCTSVPVDALALHNGAVVFIGDECIHNSGIAPDTTKYILRTINAINPDATLSAEVDDNLYANFDVSVHWGNIAVTHTDFSDIPNKPADKIIVGVSGLEEIKRYADILPDDLYIELSDGKLGLIMKKTATKWAAVQTLGKRFDIPTSNIIAFGDDYNDVGMLHGCGLGIAMANAIDECKVNADYICDTNDNDGVAKWLAKNVLRYAHL